MAKRIIKGLDATIISSLNVIDSAQSSNYPNYVKYKGISFLVLAYWPCRRTFSYHVGQIAFGLNFTKTDLEFYKDQDLNQKTINMLTNYCT